MVPALVFAGPHASLMRVRFLSGRIGSWRERLRYNAAQWDHQPSIVEHTADGDRWRGFAAAKELAAVSDGIVLIPLPGHTRGHACVAVDAGDRWILHCGDAFFHHGQIDGHSRVPPLIRAFEASTALQPAKVRDNHARLRELYGRAEPDLLLICAHDAAMYENVRAAAV